MISEVIWLKDRGTIFLRCSDCKHARKLGTPHTIRCKVTGDLKAADDHCGRFE